MGGFVKKVFGGGSKPDTSAYDRQLAEQRAAAEKAEKEAIKKQIEADEQAEEDAKKAILEAEKAAEAKKQEAERNAKIAQLKADYQAAVARGEFTGTLVDYLERK